MVKPGDKIRTEDVGLEGRLHIIEESEASPSDATICKEWLRGKSQAEIQEQLRRSAMGQSHDVPANRQELVKQIVAGEHKEIADQRAEIDAIEGMAWAQRVGVRLRKGENWHEVKAEREQRAQMVVVHMKELGLPPEIEAKVVEVLETDIAAAEAKVEHLKTAYALQNELDRIKRGLRSGHNI